MSADFEIVQGDTAPLFTDTLSYSDGSPVDLTGKSVTFIMRSLVAAAPLTLAGTPSVTNALAGAVQFAPSSADTATAGAYMAQWYVPALGMTFPTAGYLSVLVHPNLNAAPTQLVSLSDVKEHLGIPSDDRRHDARLVSLISAVRPVVENITGPIIQAVFDERHNGGGPFIQVRRRPSSTYGTTPVLTLLTASEDLGTQTYDLSVVAHPGLGTTYSCMIDQGGAVTRLTGGGGQGAFAGGTDSVHITYRAGQSTTPPNVYEGTLELLRVNYQTTMAVGRGRLTVSDDQDTGPALGFFVPRMIREMLAPNRRAPAVG